MEWVLALDHALKNCRTKPWIKEGVLYKLGGRQTGIVRSWKKRYFFLGRGRLDYYAFKGGEDGASVAATLEFKGSVPLLKRGPYDDALVLVPRESAKGELSAPDLKNHTSEFHYFAVRTIDGPLIVAAESSIERDEWAQATSRAAAQLGHCEDRCVSTGFLAREERTHKGEGKSVVLYCELRPGRLEFFIRDSAPEAALYPASSPQASETGGFATTALAAPAFVGCFPLRGARIELCHPLSLEEGESRGNGAPAQEPTGNDAFVMGSHGHGFGPAFLLTGREQRLRLETANLASLRTWVALVTSAIAADGALPVLLPDGATLVWVRRAQALSIGEAVGAVARARGLDAAALAAFDCFGVELKPNTSVHALLSVPTQAASIVVDTFNGVTPQASIRLMPTTSSQSAAER
mmetsp:Transcript_11133/g.36642  ORF Transcript_11133/g.36642 Transcript_11133/m.36642 type:complete len:408 (-) Transcript_11133:106-1329(-)